MKNFNFNVDRELMCGIKRLAPVLGFGLGEGIAVRAELGDKLGVCKKGNCATVYYTKKHQFFRELGILTEHASDEEFEIFEDSYFKDISVMFNVSSGAAQTVDAFCKMIDYLAVMGYGAAMLYTEDLIELKTRPYYGYMHGRYSEEELRSIDGYAYEYGIEMIPCLECYGHMGRYLEWDEAAPIRDTGTVLLAREEETFKFLDELICKVSLCFRSRRINIGMDEAWDMGRGTFLDRHGYVPPIDIFNEYMDRLMPILEKYGYEPMMWCDMYFRAHSKNGRDYYAEYINISDETASRIPKNMSLVFWHYGEEPGCDEYMLKKLNALDRHIIYAGGLWDWNGFFPENNYAMLSCKESLAASRKCGIRDAMVTAWYGSDNAFFANLLGLSDFAEMCYDENANGEKKAARFKATAGGDYGTFLAMSGFHNKFDSGETYENFNDRFLGLALFWQDILAGVYDSHLESRPMSEHYARHALIMKNAPKDRWSGLYGFAYKAFDYLSTKTYIAENLRHAYESCDLEALRAIAEKHLPLLREKTAVLKNAHRELFLSENKSFGLIYGDRRYGGVIARAETAELLIKRYLDGDRSALLELEEPRLHKALSGFNNYISIAATEKR